MTAGTLPRASAADAAPSERLVTLTAGLGMLLSTLDTGIITVALPTLERTFGVTAAGISWAVSGYVVALTATIVIFGRLADRLGRVRVFRWGMLTFAAGSALSALAVSAATLVAARVLQGIGAAMLQATAAALITTLVPVERRGAALGTMGMMIGAGPVLGPAVGGLLLSATGWRWIFWINLPVCAAALVLCRALRRCDVPSGRRVSADAPGNALLASAIAALLVGLSLVSSGRGLALASLAAAVVLLALFLVREWRAEHPAVSLALFRSAPFSAALYSSLAFGAATAVLFVLPPFLLQTRLHFAGWQIGLVGALGPVGVVAASRWSGSRIERLGARRLMSAGLVMMLAALTALAVTHRTVSVALLAPLLLLYGIGGGLFQPANIAAVMAAETRTRQGTIAAVQRMAQNIGIALGVTVSTAMLTAARAGGGVRQLEAAGQGWAFAAALVAVGLGGFLALALRTGGRVDSSSKNSLTGG